MQPSHMPSQEHFLPQPGLSLNPSIGLYEQALQHNPYQHVLAPTPTTGQVTQPTINAITASMSSLGVEGRFSTRYDWILDTGAIDHVCFSLDLFHDMCPIHNVVVNLPDKSSLIVTHISTVMISSTLVFHNVLYVPSFTYNLVSASKLATQSSCCLVFSADRCVIQAFPHNYMIGQAKLFRGLYHLNFPSKEAQVVVVSSQNKL